MGDLTDSMKISAAGMKVQGVRVRVISENMANADSLAQSPGTDPYRRQVVSFQNVMDRELGLKTVQIKKIGKDSSEFGDRYDPGHPAANDEGYIKTTNVNGLVEMMDLRQAQRSYEANLNAITMSKTMLQRTVDMLR